MRKLRQLFFLVLVAAALATTAQAQPRLLLLGFQPADLTVTNAGQATVRFDVQNTPPNRCDVTIFRDDGASTLVAGLTPGTGPFTVTVPLPRGVDGRRVTLTGVVQDTVTGRLTAGDRQLTIIADDTAPRPPNITSPAFPATVNSNTLTVTGTVVKADNTPETSGTITITRLDPPNAGTLIGAGAIRADGSFTATADLTGFTTGVATRIGFRAEDGATNKSQVLERVVTKAAVANPTLSNLTMDPPPGTLTNNPAVLVRGTVTGTNGPFIVNFLVDGFLESQVFLLNSGDNFAHTLTLSTDGIHNIAVRAQNSNSPPNSGTLVNLGQITLDRSNPAAPVIVEPNPAGATPVVTATFTVRGFSGERSPSATSTAKPVILINAPQGVTFSPASPLPIDNSTGQFQTAVNVANLEDGQHRITFATRDAAGNTGPGSSVDVFFIKDTRAPVIDQVRVNGTIAPQTNPEIFAGQGPVAIEIRTNEDLVNVPKLEVVQNGGAALPAGVSTNTARIFNYTYGAIPGFDGPARVQVSGGRDRAGNTLTAAIDRVFIVDTTPPQVTSVQPKDASTISSSPVFIRVTFRDPPSSAQTASGVDLTRSTIIVEGPLGSQSQTLAGTATPFDPFTLDFFPSAPLRRDGTYRIRVIAVDKVNNRAENFSSTFLLDTTPIVPSDKNVLPNPAQDACVNAATIPGTSAQPVISVRVTDPQVDLNRTSIVVRDFCRVPPEIPGTRTIVPPDTIRFTFAQPLAIDGSQDGTYNIGVTLRDIAGNTSNEFNRQFRYDTLKPSVQATFPTSNSSISGPLRAVDATLLDPRFDACRERCGIDRSNSTTELLLFLDRPNPLLSRNRNATLPLQIQGTLRFISVGNFDKVLLEILGPDLQTNGLRTDGTDDGVYRLVAVAIDRAGNRSAVTSASFNFDNIQPDLFIDNVRDGVFLTGNEFTLTGRARDNVSGSGIDRVTMSLEAVDANGNLTTAVPIFQNLVARLDPPTPGQSNELRNFTSVGDIRAVTAPTMARLTVKAIDRAGNAQESKFQVNLQTSALRPPELSSPPSKHTTNNPIVNFTWIAVPGAANYLVRIKGPNNDERTFSTEGRTSFSINLAPLTMGDGVYFWAVASVDPLGHQGVFSQNRQLVLDREKPRVVAVDIIDPSPESVGTINEGEVRFTIKFSEKMDERFALAPRIRSQNVRAPLLEVTQTTFDGIFWTGRAMIPDSGPNGTDFNGLAELQILGARDGLGNEQPPRDPAGNTLASAPTALLVFEINTGPFFRVGLFQNPIDKKDVILFVKGFTRDGGVPQRVDESLTVVVKRTGANNQSPQMIRINDSTFRGTFRLDTASSQPVRLEITGRDRLGNSTTHNITLSVTLLGSGTAVVSTSDGVLSLKTAEGAMQAEAMVMTAASPGTLMKAELTAADQPELLPVAHLEQFSPAGVTFAGTAELTANLARISPQIAPEVESHAGLYTLEQGRWRPLRARREGRTLIAAVGGTGPFALFADRTGPAVSGIESGAGEVRAQVTDGGSGIDVAACTLLAGGASYGASYDEASGTLTWKAPAGDHDAEVVVADLAGNKTSSSVRLSNHEEFAVRDAIAYPNPARFGSTIRYRLTQAADSVRVRVYDMSGARVAVMDGPASAGVQTVDWPLVTGDGEPVANGVYVARVEAAQGGRKSTGRIKIAVLR